MRLLAAALLLAVCGCASESDRATERHWQYAEWADKQRRVTQARRDSVARDWIKRTGGDSLFHPYNGEGWSEFSRRRLVWAYTMAMEESLP